MLLRDYVREARISNTPKSGLVVGSAPNIKKIKNLFFNGTIIGVGDVPWRASNLARFDYWVCANTYFPIPWERKHKKALELSNAKVLIASNVVENYELVLDEVFQKIEDSGLLSQYLFYDQRHFNGVLCNPPKSCCKFYRRYLNESTIQELVSSSYSDSDSPAYSEGTTVALHGYALAILLQLNPIYLIGIELPEKLSDYKAYKNWKRPGEKIKSKLKRLLLQNLPFIPTKPIDFSGKKEEILEDFRKLCAVGESVGIKTYSLSETSPLNTVPGINFTSSIDQ